MLVTWAINRAPGLQRSSRPLCKKSRYTKSQSTLSLARQEKPHLRCLFAGSTGGRRSGQLELPARGRLSPSGQVQLKQGSKTLLCNFPFSCPFVAIESFCVFGFSAPATSLFHVGQQPSSPYSTDRDTRWLNARIGSPHTSKAPCRCLSSRRRRGFRVFSFCTASCATLMI